MAQRSNVESANELAEEFELLRARLLRSARALVLVEDRRAQILGQVAAAAGNPPAINAALAEQRRAEANAVTAMAAVVQLRRLDPSPAADEDLISWPRRLEVVLADDSKVRC